MKKDKKEEYIQTTITLSPKVNKQIEYLSKTSNLSKSSLIRTSIERLYIEYQNNPDILKENN